MQLSINLGIDTRALALIRDRLRSFWRQESFLVERELRLVTPIGATSKLLGGIRSDSNEVGCRTFIGGEASKYADFVEHGRGPGGYPPPDKIRAWLSISPKGKRFVNAIAADYGLTGEAALRSATFLKSRGIAQRGTPAQNIFSDTEDKLAPRFESDLETAIELALRAVFS